ncbi:MAG: cyclic nucleotide-binding domain-containing protein [bacterium]
MKLTPADVEAVKDALKKISFFEYLRPEELDELLRGFDKQPFRKRDTLITQGKTGEVFYILAAGSVGIFRSRKLVDRKIATLGPQGFFGEMSLISNEPRSASVVAETDGVVFTLSRDTFRRVILGNPHIASLIRRTAKDRQAEARAIELKERMGEDIAE